MDHELHDTNDHTITHDGNSLRIVVDGDLATIYHNGRQVASRTGEVGLLIINVNENARTVVYDIAVLRSGYVRCFVGRDGLLIHSDGSAVRPARKKAK